MYDLDKYRYLHPHGPKSDYDFRLTAPDRAALAGMRQINIGALLGLNDWRTEVVALAKHTEYLLNMYPDIELGLSFPRLRPEPGGYESDIVVTDVNMVQIITAMRLLFPRVGITISTREPANFRENVLSLGITRISADSITSVGGHIGSR